MKRICFIGNICLLAICLGACRLGKQYTRPDLRLPEQIADVPADTTSVQDIKWSELYADPVLQQLIRKTLENNKDMLMAAAKVKELMESKRIAKADLLPKVDAFIGGEREYDASPGNTFEGKLLASWEVDLWGKLRWANQAAVAAYLQSVEGRQALRLSLIANVAQAYFELIALDQELTIVKQTLEARREGVRLAKLRFEGGLTSENPMRQAQVELAKTQTLVPDLEKSIRLKENQISLLAGEYPGVVERGKSIEQQQLMATLPVGLPSQLLERRPDIRQAEYRLKEAHAKAGVAFTNMFPKFTLTGHYGLESTEFSNFLRDPYFLVSGKLLTPLFNMGKNRAQWRASKAVKEQEIYNYQKVVLKAFTEVSNALISSQKSREIRKAREHLENSARSNLDLATLQYINGVISYLDVLDAQRGYFDAQIGLNNAIRDELLATVELYKVLGGGEE